MITVTTTVVNKLAGWTRTFDQHYARNEKDRAEYYVLISRFENAEWVISACIN